MTWKYPVNEIFESVQGEGLDTGLPVTFVRLAGCNMCCPFCDTDFSEYKLMTVGEIVDAVGPRASRVVLTGGEPTLQPLEPLLEQLNEGGVDVDIETNGTREVPQGLHHVNLSPKVPRTACALTQATSLKLLFPYLPGVRLDEWVDFPALYRSLQLIEPWLHKELAQEAEAECRRVGGGWRVGVQLHKYIHVK